MGEGNLLEKKVPLTLPSKNFYGEGGWFRSYYAEKAGTQPAFSLVIEGDP